MTEDELIELGFEKTIIPVEESGAEKDYWYYTLYIGDVSLMSTDNEDSGRKSWSVEIFDTGTWIKDFEDLDTLIRILKKYTK
jgi:hypothetical protein